MTSHGNRVIRAALIVLATTAAASGARAGSFHRDFEDLLMRTPADAYVSGLVMGSEQLDRMALEEQISRLGLSSRWRRHQFVVQTAQELAARAQTGLLQKLEELRGQGRVRSYQSFWITNMVAVDARPEVFRILVRRGDVGVIHVNAEAELRMGLDDGPPERDGGGGGMLPTPTLPANLICVNVEPAWTRNYHGEGRLVALFDTGADGHHPAFASLWRGAEPGVNWWEAWKDPFTDTTFPYDSGTHGTHVLGIILATEPDGTEIGVAPSARWIAAGVLIGSNVQKVIECYQWAVDPDGDPGTIDDVPDVINNSWGSSSDCSQTYWNAIDIVEAAGIVNTISVDNRGPNPASVNSPESRAESPTVNWGVGNVDPHVAGYPIWNSSGRGPSPCDMVSIKPEVTAPGVQIYSCLPNNGYGYKTGASMACPHTSGAVAILRQVNPDLTVDEVKTILMATALDRGSEGEDNDYGWGIIDIGAAVDYAFANLPNYPPQDLTAFLIDVNRVRLVWQRPEKIFQNNPVLNYRVYRARVTESFPQEPIAEIWDMTSVISYTDVLLESGEYKYVVTANFQTGESGPSNVVEIELAAAVPLSLTAQAVADTVRLGWLRPQSPFPADTLQAYKVWRAAIGEPFPPDPIASVADSGSAIAYADTALALGAYHYAVSAVYQGSESALSNEAEALIALDPPRNLTASVVADTVQLGWDQPEHASPANPVESYRVWRTVFADSFPPDPIAVFADSGSVVTFTETGVALGSYRYAVSADYGWGESVLSNVAQVQVALEPPRNLTANVFADTVFLGWERPEHVFPLHPILSFSIWRAAVGDSFPPSPIASVPDSSLAYVDSSLALGEYRYAVSAVYEAGESALSGEANALIALDPPRTLTSSVVADSVFLEWERPARVNPQSPVQAYRVWRAASGDSFPQDPIAVFAHSGDVIAFTDTGLGLGRYDYAVSADYGWGESVLSNVTQALVALDAPRSLTASVDAFVVTLSWEPPEHTGGRSVEAYRLYRVALGDTFPPQPHAMIPDSIAVRSYSDTVSAGRYIYACTALYDVGESGTSNQAGADVGVPPPRFLTSAATGDSVFLSWRIPVGIVETNPLQGYQLFRAALDEPLPQAPFAEFAADSSDTVLAYVDLDVPAGRYHYAVAAVYPVASSPLSNDAYAFIELPAAGVGDLPAAAVLAPLRIAPNPFNASTVIHYRPADGAALRIEIRDARGALVKTLLNSRSPVVTEQSVLWDGRDNRGRRVASGTYFVRMTQADRHSARRITLLK